MQTRTTDHEPATLHPDHDEPTVLVLDYDISELPSPQHRAGLAGLVLVLRRLGQRVDPERGICELVSVSKKGATIKIDQRGLASLFDEIYAATMEEREYASLRKDRNKKIIAPLRELMTPITDVSTKTSVRRRVHVYAEPVPRGSFLADIDPSDTQQVGPWIALWRDAIVSLFRVSPLSHRPYESRARGEQTTDALDSFEELLEDRVLDSTSSDVARVHPPPIDSPFTEERARHRLLLHFWLFTTSVYCPAVLDGEGKRNLVGYALAIPDIADLDAFCRVFPEMLRGRSPEMLGSRPRRAIIDVPTEAGLDTLCCLSDQLVLLGDGQTITDLLSGVDVVHVGKGGEDLRKLGALRLDRDLPMVTEYGRVRDAYWDPSFRGMRIANIVKSRPWFHGFDGLVGLSSKARTIESATFRRDAREAFARVEVRLPENSDGDLPPLEVQVYRVIADYIARKVETGHRLRWEEVQEVLTLRAEYEEACERVAADSFLAIRGRTNFDFVSYFSGTLFTVTEQQSYLSLTQVLIEDPSVIRALTLLALSSYA